MSKTLGIAFGGSGAEAIACVAYIRALEEMEIKPDIVSGTGMGAVVAAMYAAGMTSAAMTDFLKEIDFPGSKRPVNIVKLKDAKQGILDGMGLEEYFQMVVPIKVFDRLYFPLKIVAASYETGEEVIFADGDVAAAVRAAVSVPGIFSPYAIGGANYIDGSCVNPVPFDIIRGECDVLVAIDPSVNQDMSLYGPGVFGSLLSAYDAARKALTIEKQSACAVDLHERVVVEEITAYDFARFEDIIASVEEKTESFKSALLELIK
jgi:NTE family protein